MTTYHWDEISCAVVADYDNLPFPYDWTRQPNIGPVEVYMSTRGHIALQVKAVNRKRAEGAFSLSTIYREHMGL